jgi:hypothetical protein
MRTRAGALDSINAGSDCVPLGARASRAKRPYRRERPPRKLMVALPARLQSRNNTEDNAGALVMVAFPPVAPSLNTIREAGKTLTIVTSPAVLLLSKLTMSLLKIVALPPFTKPASVNRTAAMGESAALCPDR